MVSFVCDAVHPVPVTTSEATLDPDPGALDPWGKFLAPPFCTAYVGKCLISSALFRPCVKQQGPHPRHGSMAAAEHKMPRLKPPICESIAEHARRVWPWNQGKGAGPTRLPPTAPTNVIIARSALPRARRAVQSFSAASIHFC